VQTRRNGLTNRAVSERDEYIEAVKKYIANQKEHHRLKTFENELRGFFEKYEIEYEERYVWD
jgi:uncharacterized protein YpbB